MSLALLGATTPAAAAQSFELVQMVVTAVGTDDNPPPPVPRDTVVLFQEQQRRQVVDWVPVSGQPMSLALLIDGSLGSGFGILTRDKVEVMLRGAPGRGRHRHPAAEDFLQRR